ncbi:YceI family protein [Sphingobacteriaceae bacterium WQ 2009]|uniref:YceI family protein n=1 Tax=Rhinopithecimicrobium faecis TaxID=2820698 RepID=A0A8T4H701_9SPHI|nr:YceI family protein [Sphingobacteriaceae bacterium WQ 2009]
MEQSTWNLDPAHSEIMFKVKHMMITNVKGSFDNFSITVNNSGDDFVGAQVDLSIETASINTRNEQRDTHLKSADFFDVEQYPAIKFHASKLEKVAGSDYSLTGDLTIRDVTKPVTLSVEFGGIQKDPWGNLKAGFTVEGKIKRTDYGLSWNAALETGGVMVSDEVKLSAEIQFAKTV